MNEHERITRPTLDRQAPIRSWNTLFGELPPEPGADPSGGRPPGPEDVVGRSVELGYRVIDDWMRQGQRVARRMTEGGYDPAGLGQEVQDIAARIAQHASDLFGLWLELFEMAAARGGAPPARADGASAPPAWAAANAPATAPSPKVRVEVRSGAPTDVALELRPERAGPTLVAHALRAVDPDAPRLDEVTVESAEDGGIVVRVRVPDGHPSGTYSGLIVDEASSLPVGTLSVRVGG